jgi:predicted ferric reductase
LYTGEILGVLAVVLFSGALVTAMRSNFLESLFGGIDHLYRWHRISAALGTFLLIPHLLLSFKQDPIFSSLGIALGFPSLLGLFVLVLWALTPRLLVLL